MTFGWRRAETVGGFVNSLFVLAMGVFVLLQAIPDFLDPKSTLYASLSTWWLSLVPPPPLREPLCIMCDGDRCVQDGSSYNVAVIPSRSPFVILLFRFSPSPHQPPHLPRTAASFKPPLQIPCLFLHVHEQLSRMWRLSTSSSLQGSAFSSTLSALLSLPGMATGMGTPTYFGKILSCSCLSLLGPSWDALALSFVPFSSFHFFSVFFMPGSFVRFPLFQHFSSTRHGQPYIANARSTGTPMAVEAVGMATASRLPPLMATTGTSTATVMGTPRGMMGMAMHTIMGTPTTAVTSVRAQPLLSQQLLHLGHQSHTGTHTQRYVSCIHSLNTHTHTHTLSLS